MEKHIKLLEYTCRICGQLTLRRNPLKRAKRRHDASSTNKLKYASIFTKIFSIDVHVESKEQYGQILCSNHRLWLDRNKDHGDGNDVNKDEVKVTKVAVHDAIIHTNQCTFCNKYEREYRVLTANLTDPQKHEDCKSKIPRREMSDTPSTSTDTTGVRTTYHHRVEKDFVNDIVDYFKDLSPQEAISLSQRIVNVMDEENLCCLARQLGESQKGKLLTESLNCCNEYKDVKKLKIFELSKWMSQRNPVIGNFLCGVSGKEPQGNFLLASCIDSITKLRNLKYISPLSFMQCLNIYATSGSRQAVDLASASIPGGTYGSIRQWMSSVPIPEPTPPKGVLMNVFDNEQVIGKKRGLVPKNQVKMSVITNCAFVEIMDINSPSGQMQYDPTHKPFSCYSQKQFDVRLKQTQREDSRQELQKARSTCEAAANDMLKQDSEYFRKLESVHYEHLYHFIERAIDEVKSEQKLDKTCKPDKYTDDIDKEAAAAERRRLFVICNNCGQLNQKRKRVCVQCRSKDGLKSSKSSKPAESTTTFPVPSVSFSYQKPPTSDEDDSERYEHVKSFHPENPRQLTTMEPVFVNPNSVQNVAKVLRHIGKTNNVKRYNDGRTADDNRYWTFVCCDGLPYKYLADLAESCVTCLECKAVFRNTEDFLAHKKTAHSDKANMFREFNWYYIKIGLGHYEMNVMKAFMELNWIPFMEKLAEEMGFTSDAAKNYAKNCKDNHIAWQMILTHHLGSLRELVNPYVRHCLKHGEFATAHGFLEFNTANPRGPLFSYILEQTCRYSQAIINLRMGVRRNNSTLVHSAKYMTKELFFGRNHPKYQNIEVHETMQYLCMPPTVREVFDWNMSMTSGDRSSGEGYDFKLEEKNREIKKYLPTGQIPSDLSWRQACFFSDHIKDIQDSFCHMTSTKTTTGKKQLQLKAAISAWRVVLRSNISTTKYNHNDEEENFRSIKGVNLHPNLLNFTSTALRKRMIYILTNILNKKVNVAATEKHPVYVTPEEFEQRNKIENQTKIQIGMMLQECLNKLQDADYAHFSRKVEETYKVEKGNKQSLINLYLELSHFVSQMEVDDDSFPVNTTESNQN